MEAKAPCILGVQDGRSGGLKQTGVTPPRPGRRAAGGGERPQRAGPQPSRRAASRVGKRTPLSPTSHVVSGQSVPFDPLQAFRCVWRNCIAYGGDLDFRANSKQARVRFRSPHGGSPGHLTSLAGAPGGSSLMASRPLTPGETRGKSVSAHHGVCAATGQGGVTDNSVIQL